MDPKSTSAEGMTNGYTFERMFQSCQRRLISSRQTWTIEEEKGYCHDPDTLYNYMTRRTTDLSLGSPTIVTDMYLAR